MAEDFDVEAMLEAPYMKEDDVSQGKSNGDRDDRDRRRRSRDRDRDDRDRKRRSRSRDRDRDRKRRDRDDRDRGRSSDRERRDRERDRDRSSRDKPRRRSRSKDRTDRFRKRSTSPIRTALPEMTPEERDARTVFCMQLAARIRPRDLEEFFSSVGQVRDVRIITDNKTRRSKGIAYIEFKDTESVTLALGLNGQRLLGVPILVQASQAEKNRVNAATVGIPGIKGHTGPMRLYVGSLHFNITEDMLKGIFSPFGKIEHINLVMDNETGRSKGFGFVSFHDSDDAKKALEQLNGFELAGRPMKVGHVTERTPDPQGSNALDTDELDRAGIDLGATGRLQLMAKLAEGTGFQLPQAAANALNMPQSAPPNTSVPGVPQQASPAPPAQQAAAPPIATQCFMLSNMFDPITESSPTWEQEIRDDVIEECNKHGGVLHIYVDRASPQGNVYVKCPSIAAAVASVTALHGRFFAGRIITAAYVPLPNYHQLFPMALNAVQLVMPSTIRQSGFM
ncbi:unnamed protein product [Owenia fusiformis]|uniref:Uncharacterized protein n=1 Tax=Owenia fusiformis TaxID=6347 RepID=A0A8J1UPH9_OWEFU|nr:unnamed protein product [Owenia fusiformis]